MGCPAHTAVEAAARHPWRPPQAAGVARPQAFPLATLINGSVQLSPVRLKQGGMGSSSLELSARQLAGQGSPTRLPLCAALVLKQL